MCCIQVAGILAVSSGRFFLKAQVRGMQNVDIDF